MRIARFFAANYFVPSRGRLLREQHFALHPGDHRLQIMFAFLIAEQKRLRAALHSGVALHHA